MKYLITGCAGFIGSKICEKLLNRDNEVIGIDNLNDYYDVRLKYYRLELLKKYKNFKFVEADIENYQSLLKVFLENKFEAVINEAARAGVRYSLENPFIYMTTNVLGTLNLLELCRKYDVNKFILASTSSLYAGLSMPFKEDLPVNTPISPYAASKKSAETLAYTYYYQYGMDVSILRYFTVYGPAGRPDMSIFRFIKWIIEEVPLEIFGDGNQSRDFTYVDDIAEGTILSLKPVGYEIINLGGNSPYKLSEIINLIEKYTGKKAKFIMKEFHKADIKATWADITKAKKILGWQPNVTIEEGIKRTIEWFLKNWDYIKNISI